MNLGDFDIGIKVTDYRGFLVVYRAAAGDVQSRLALNRTVLHRVVLMEAIPAVRGDPPAIEEIDIHAPHSRRQGDS